MLWDNRHRSSDVHLITKMLLRSCHITHFISSHFGWTEQNTTRSSTLRRHRVSQKATIPWFFPTSSVKSKFVAPNVSDSIVNAFYLVLGPIRWKFSAFRKIQWLHFTGEVYIFITIWWYISQIFRVPIITKIRSFLTELFKKSRCHHFPWNTV